MRRVTHWIVTTLILSLPFPLILYGESSNPSDDEQTIRRASAAIQEAFDHGDAKAMADLWIEQGEFIDQFGYLLKGRTKIANSFGQILTQHRGAKMRIAIRSITFPHQDLAVETGSTSLEGIDADGPIEANYSATYVRENGNWLLKRFHEAPPLPPSNYQHLKSLAWLVGTWVDEQESAEEGSRPTSVVYTTCSWSPNRNFLIRTFTATVNDQVTTTGTQWIGWDAVAKRIRSWTFDSKGGIIVGLWTQEDNEDDWVVRVEEHLISGEKLKSTEKLKRDTADTHSWHVTDRSMGDQPLPDEVFKVRRYK